MRSIAAHPAATPSTSRGGALNKFMRRSLPLLAVPALIALLLAAAASAHRAAPTRSAASIEACALLPDTTSSTRYQLFDKPYLEAAFKAANVSATVLNAQGSAQTQRSQGDQCLTQGAKVTGVNGKSNNKVRNVPSLLLKPVWITKVNYKLPFKDGSLKKSQVC